MKILNTDQVLVQNHCLVYGPAKIGKTYLATTAPTPFVLDMDQGVSCLKGLHIPYGNITTWAEWLDAYQWVISSAEAKKYDTIFVDDLTELAELFLVMEKPRHKNLMQAYGALNDTMMRTIRSLRQITDRTIVFNCKQDKIKDELVGGMIYGPMIPGKAVAPMLPYLVGEVYHLFLWQDDKGATHRCFHTARDATNQFDAGSRSGKLAPIEFAHLGNIFTKVKS